MGSFTNMVIDGFNVQFKTLENNKKYACILGAAEKKRVLNTDIIYSGLRGCDLLEIADHAFSDNQDLQEVILGKRLSGIGYSAFYQCKNLKRIFCQDANLIEIPRTFAKGCGNLTELVLPKSLQTISEEAFAQCGRLETLEIPALVSKIKPCAFLGCGGLKKVVFYDSLRSAAIGDKAFGSCPSLTDVVFSHRVTVIGKEAFAESHQLKRADIHWTVKNYVENHCFSENTKVFCYNLNARSPGRGKGYHIGGNATISYTMVENATRVILLEVNTGGEKGVGIPEKVGGIPVTSIADGAIAFRSQVEKMVFRKNIREIGIMGIYGCPDLKLIIMEHETKEQVPKLYSNAIAHNPSAVVCVQNKEVFDQMIANGYKGPMFSLAGGKENQVSYRFTSFMDGYMLHLTGNGPMKSRRDRINSEVPWNLIQRHIRAVTVNGFETIGAYTFCGLENLVEVTVDSGVKWISQYAFADCTKLERINLPTGLKKIYSHAFYNCRSLKEITFPESLELIGSHAFYMTALENIIIPQNVKTVGTSAFMECRNLRTVYLQALEPMTLGSTASPVNTVFYNMAEDCVIYTKISHYTSLSNNCNHTTRVVEPEEGTAGDVVWRLDYEGVLEIKGRETGRKCSVQSYREDTPPWFDTEQPVKKVHISKEVTEIGAGSFFCCGMEEVELEGAEIIKAQAFAGNPELKKVILPKTLKEIAPDAFIHSKDIVDLLYHGTAGRFERIANVSALFGMKYTPEEQDSFNKNALILKDGTRKQLDPAADIGEWTDGEVLKFIWKKKHKNEDIQGGEPFYTVGSPIETTECFDLTEISMPLSEERKKQWRIAYQVCSTDEQWMEWHWHGETASIKVMDGGFCPIMHTRFQLIEKSCRHGDIPELFYYVSGSRGCGPLARNGEETMVASHQIDRLRLFCGIEGEFTDILDCKQHIAELGDRDVNFSHGCYLFGIEDKSLRLEGIRLKLKADFQQYQIAYRVMDEGGWQDWHKDGEFAGSSGKCRPLFGIQIEIWAKAVNN